MLEPELVPGLESALVRGAAPELVSEPESVPESESESEPEPE